MALLSLLPRRAGYFAITLFVSAVVLEVAVRLLLPAPTFVQVTQRGDSAAHPRAVHLFADDKAETLFINTERGWRLRPNTRAVIRNHTVSGLDTVIETNSLGFRGEELAPKSAADKRILFLGDSITLASYLDSDKTFVERVGRLAAAESFSVETINAGVAANGLQDHLDLLEEKLPATHPDIVVLGFYLNDAVSCCGVIIPKIPPVLGSSRLVYYASLIAARHTVQTDSRRGAKERLTAWAERFRQHHPIEQGDPLTSREAFNAMVYRDFYDYGNAWSEEVWDYLKPEFERFKRLAEENSFKPVVAAFPIRAQVEAGFLDASPQQHLNRLTTELQLPLVDLLPVLRAESQLSRKRLYFDHCHPNVQGNALVAAELWRFIKTAL